MGKYKDILKSLNAGTAGVRAKIPGVYEGFGSVYRVAYADGALSAKHKELIAVGIAVREGCDGCIASHVRSAVRKGASAEEMAETIGVAIQMGGGPASIYASHAWDAYEEFSADSGPQTMS
ncbi:MAG: carboxymuconolactone decarboxylase family protein [Acidimicrobiia bacterium]|nr:carboxymuconolactone decarboxylase family protein [Acidimicrobiia bacterium]